MKKSLIILAILATALSCAKEASVKDSAEKTSNANLQEMSFTASFEADTKAVLNNDRSVSSPQVTRLHSLQTATNMSSPLLRAAQTLSSLVPARPQTPTMPSILIPTA
jgi:hypothetical protein